MAKKKKTTARKGKNRDKTTSEILDILGVTHRTLRNWMKEGLPYTKGTAGRSNMFDESEVAAWMKNTGRTGQPGRPKSETSNDRDHWSMRKEKALAEKYELQLERERGQLIEKAVVEQRWTNIANALQHTLQSQAAQLAPRLVGKTAQQIEEELETDTKRRLNNACENALNFNEGDT